MIDILQNTVLVVLDILLASIKQSTYQRQQVFIPDLSFQANTHIPNRQSTLQIIHTIIENSFS